MFVVVQRFIRGKSVMDCFKDVDCVSFCEYEHNDTIAFKISFIDHDVYISLDEIEFVFLDGSMIYAKKYF